MLKHEVHLCNFYSCVQYAASQLRESLYISRLQWCTLHYGYNKMPDFPTAKQSANWCAQTSYRAAFNCISSWQRALNDGCNLLRLCHGASIILPNGFNYLSSKFDATHPKSLTVRNIYLPKTVANLPTNVWNCHEIYAEPVHSWRYTGKPLVA